MKLIAKKFLKNLAIATPLAFVPTASVMVLDAIGVSAESFKVYAQEERKTRKTPALSQAVYKKLAVPNGLANPEEEGVEPDFKKALEELKKLEAKDAKSWNEYEVANLYNTFGYVYYSLENFPQAIKYYKLVVAQSPNIPEGLEIGTIFTIAQLQFVSEDYAGALESLKKWFTLQDPMFITADNYSLLAQAYYQNKQFDQALSNIYKAIDIYKKKGELPKENWYSIALAIEFERENYKEVVGILEILVRNYPKPAYFKQLAGVYGLVNKEKNQMYLSDANYVAGFSDKQQEVLNLVYMMMGEGYSYRAAKVLEKGIDSKLIDGTEKNYELLSNAWLISQETDKAIDALTKAAEKSGSGDLYARLAGLYADDDQSKKALEFADIAFKKGGIKREDSLYISVGIANANLARWAEAVKAFEEASKDSRSKAFASNWKKYAESELDRELKLAADEKKANQAKAAKTPKS